MQTAKIGSDDIEAWNGDATHPNETASSPLALERLFSKMEGGGGGAYKRLSKEVSTQFLEQQNSREVLDAYLKREIVQKLVQCNFQDYG